MHTCDEESQHVFQQVQVKCQDVISDRVAVVLQQRWPNHLHKKVGSPQKREISMEQRNCFFLRKTQKWSHSIFYSLAFHFSYSGFCSFAMHTYEETKGQTSGTNSFRGSLCLNLKRDEPWSFSLSWFNSKTVLFSKRKQKLTKCFWMKAMEICRLQKNGRFFRSSENVKAFTFLTSITDLKGRLHHLSNEQYCIYIVFLLKWQ